LDFRQWQARNDEDLRIVGAKPAVVERRHLVARECLYSRWIAQGRRRVGVVLAVKDRRKHPVGNAVGVFLGLVDRRQQLRAYPLHFRRRERGPLDDVGKKVERGAKVGTQRRHRHSAAIRTALRIDLRAEPLLLLRNLLRRHAIRAFVEQAHREVLKAALVRRVGGKAGVE
jgi:hypothetical protein